MWCPWSLFLFVFCKISFFFCDNKEAGRVVLFLWGNGIRNRKVPAGGIGGAGCRNVFGGDGLSYGRGGREQPFPCGEDADGFAVAGEGVFLVVGDDEEVVAAGGTGGFEDACDFPFTGSGVFHVPSGLEEL